MPGTKKPVSQLVPGAFRRNRARARVEPTPTGPLGGPPRHLSPAQRAAWREIVAIAPRGVLFKSDKFIVEVAALLLGRLREDGIGGERGMSNAEVGLLSTVLGKCGLSPADRSKVSVILPSPIERNPFSELAGGLVVIDTGGKGSKGGNGARGPYFSFLRPHPSQPHRSR